MKQKGFTLIEVMVVVVIVASASIVLANMYIGQNRLYRSTSSELDITSSVRTALSDVDDYVRQSNRTLSSYSTYTAGSQVLILQIQSVNSAGRLVAGSFDYVIYYLDGSGNLMRQVVADPSSSRISATKGVGSHITSLAFTYNNADYAQVTEVATSITASEAAGPQTRTFTADSKAELRDY